MKTILVILAVLCFFVSQSLAFRCDGNLIQIGDSGFQLLLKCGEPNQKRDLGYTITPDGKWELIVEKWIYGPEGGYYYEITLEGDRITGIEQVRQ